MKRKEKRKPKPFSREDFLRHELTKRHNNAYEIYSSWPTYAAKQEPER